MRTAQQDIYLTRNDYGEVEIWDALPEKDQWGFYTPTDAVNNWRKLDGDAICGLLSRWTGDTAWQGEPVRLTLTACGRG